MGNVGTKPNVRLAGDKTMATFALATNERIKKNDGTEVTELTEWHNIVMWGRSAEIAEKYIDVGTKLFIEGKLRTRTWQDRNAIERRTTEIIVENFDILSRPSQKAAENNQQA